MSRLLPLQPVPALDLPLAGGGRFTLSGIPPEGFTLLSFYRGLHCPICRGQLSDLQERLGALAEAGVRAVAISMDGRERAEQAKSDWGLAQLDLAHDLPEQTARDYGLYISGAISDMAVAGSVWPKTMFCSAGWINWRISLHSAMIGGDHMVGRKGTNLSSGGAVFTDWRAPGAR